MSGAVNLKGRTIRIFLADGAPSGILTAEIMDWTGKVVVTPRTRLALPIGEPQIIKGASEVGTAQPKDDDLSALSKVIDLINEKFGTDFAEGDRLLMEQALDDLSSNTTLEAQARTNTLENFRHAFEPVAMDAILNRNQRNGEITEQYLRNADLRRMMLDAMMLDYYQRARRGEPSGDRPA